MMISTKGRYALRVMLDLADHNTGEYIPLKDIAHRQEISVKYLENILASLSRVNLVDAARGKGGGYRLAKTPADYSAGEIIRLAEGSLASVSCLKGEKKGCEKAGHCRALPPVAGAGPDDRPVSGQLLPGRPAKAAGRAGRSRSSRSPMTRCRRPPLEKSHPSFQRRAAFFA